MTKGNIPTTVAKGSETAEREAQATPVTTREENRYLIPPVDIFESADGLVVMADLPGVEKDGLDINVEDDILTIVAKPSFQPLQNSIYAEFALINFFRQFQLSDHVDQNKISAELKNGVLKLMLPKAEKIKPKKIAVNVG